MLVRHERARERRGDERAFEVLGRSRGRNACGDGEEVDEFEDEEAWEGLAEVRNSVSEISMSSFGRGVVDLRGQ